MNLHFIDWAIVASLMIFMIIAVRLTRRYTKSVADYLAANRCAGRYLISVSETMAAIGAITIVASFEAYFNAGFTFLWWGMLGGVMFFVTLAGWVQYRFRQTRALTMAQFLEMRYGKTFRLFFGIQAFATGILGFGIFPAVGARFFMFFCGFPSKVIHVGVLEIDLTMAAIMAVLLTVSLYFTFAGGQIAVIVTDFIQGVFSNIAFLAVMLFLLYKIPWETLYHTCIQRSVGTSMLDPFDTSKLDIFNMWFFVIHIIILIWYFMADQTIQGYNSSAISAHEARMGKALGVWRMSMQGAPIVVVAVMAYVIMHNPEYSFFAEKTQANLAQISADSGEVIARQVTTSVVMAHFLPIGMLGAMCAVMLASFISTHDTCLHSWGSILIQDVILPFRKERLSPQKHLKLLKLSAVGVAVWVFLFSLLFNQFNFIFMFFDLIAIIGAGTGSAIVFGLYWKRGTKNAAFCSMIVGMLCFLICTILEKSWPAIYGTDFPLDSRELRFSSMLITIAAYVVASLMKNNYKFNMDKMLHRGQYAVASDVVVKTEKPIKKWMAKIGITKEFNLQDRIIYFFFSIWQLSWFCVFIVVIILHVFHDISDRIWSYYWKYNMWMMAVLAIITLIWFTWGGIVDLKKMFKKLSSEDRDINDDGEIINSNSESK